MKKFRRCLRMDRCPTDVNREEWERERMLAQLSKLRIRYRAASASSLTHEGRVSRHESRMRKAYIGMLQEFRNRFGHWPSADYGTTSVKAENYARMTGLFAKLF